ncbi:hypothetical protein [Natrialba swarupiae]|uniref:Uncharacterized protein n=1 Tax=Natrialba swarupiae TaxID=2448032 RepID=A0A5D5AS27_9EURY|nr:hypothetical protein [Natrialba swarupiae]TYT62300.1 hypothetical protein FYC77_08735 [Natrialba swarupiae]
MSTDRSATERVKTRLFREPDGIWTGLSYIAVSLPFFALYVYFGLGYGLGNTALLLGILWILQGVPELLPERHQRAAGILRIVVIAYALILILFFLVQISDGGVEQLFS